MVGISYKGRLGNQLFQFVFYNYLRSKDKSKFFFLNNPQHADLSKYFHLEWSNRFTGTKIYSLLTRILVKSVAFEDVYMHNFVGPRAVQVANKTIYNGYFQTDWYLKNIEGGLNLKIKEKYLREFEDNFGELFRSHLTIVVHIRRTDYLNYGKRDISLPIEYFKTQLSSIQNIDNYKVIFVSDDMDYVKNEFKQKANFIYSSNSEILDFQIIQNADIAIISNSTFAWWAAYLSPKNNKVIGPKNWMGFRIGREHPRGIMTDKFDWVEVLPDAVPV
jgi:hypothetical protein